MTDAERSRLTARLFTVDGEPVVPWLEKPWDKMTADEIEATPTYQLAMMAQRDMFARHGRLEEWESETRPVLWPDLMPEARGLAPFPVRGRCAWPECGKQLGAGWFCTGAHYNLYVSRYAQQPQDVLRKRGAA
jgi:hypothetical protein